MADIEKVIKGLGCCILRDPDDHARCSQCSYESNCVNRLKMDALALLKDPDRVRVVRCADCRFWEFENAEEGDSYGRCRKNWAVCQNQLTDMNWFCADGARRNDDGS